MTPSKKLMLLIALAIVLIGVGIGVNSQIDLASLISPIHIPTTPSIFAPTAAPVTSNVQWTPRTQTFNGFDMVLVPPGCFNMGSLNGNNDEKPVTKICFDQAFWIDKSDVTQAQFKQMGGTSLSQSASAGDNHPVDSATWFEASDFCAKRDARLPTEAEWEYAARGPDDLLYPWGNAFVPDNAVYRDNYNNQLAEVGSKPNGKSWVGALDMAGNIWQWTSSIYNAYPYKPDDGRERERDTDSVRVRRGGSGWLPATFLRSTQRGYGNVIDTGSFRCARP